MNRRVAFITGVGRSEGIGAAICRELAKDGFDILFTYWTKYDEEVSLHKKYQDPEHIQQEILDIGVRCEKIELNLQDTASFDKPFKFCKKQFGCYPSVLVNNAAVSINDNLCSITPESLDDHYRINVRAVTFLTSQFVQLFEGDRGSIINLTTGWSQGPMPEELSYVLTKSAVETLTYTLASTLAEKGITINAINPGPTNSGWMNDEIKKEILAQSPSGRLGEPKDAANLVAFLASDRAQWVTGQVIHSEGGFRNRS
ncbi:SDR family oxidoreductase [Jeotgalibacillus proteolyticus]|uniref:Oxidoreductase n=1 Tax=Jeotgalibacillus proteolyticus TaxID=2082395 RepID=A0A2S5GA66_9BACL|nr:SDR family oxidoreductase [Jeotgalibacillus proteolyticus]PPA69886.1 oxidoreductase [Jeotgalibacillus proteolyticus]